MIAKIISELRPHQWLKNVLISIPAIAGHHFEAQTLAAILLAFASYSLCASTLYIFNDLLDVQHDRKHPRKKQRPIAAGALTPTQGLVLATGLLAAGLLIGLALPRDFLLALCIYLLTGATYSLYLKRLMMLDVVVLAFLYGLRVVAGGAATDIAISDWLIVFSVFFFLSLALVKRASEVKSFPGEGSTDVAGRSYRNEDLNSLQALSGAAGFVSVLVLALYLYSDEVRVLYQHPDVLWGLALILIFWVGRAILLTGRGEMHDDPVVFAITDKVSISSAIAAVIVLVLAI